MFGHQDTSLTPHSFLPCQYTLIPHCQYTLTLYQYTLTLYQYTLTLYQYTLTLYQYTLIPHCQYTLTHYQYTLTHYQYTLTLYQYTLTLYQYTLTLYQYTHVFDYTQHTSSITLMQYIPPSPLLPTTPSSLHPSHPLLHPLHASPTIPISFRENKLN
ncbi:hypothetical protein Pcinc_034342 [Petrolisthes cinctipes]|uniref:Uncharacterized protein n=1 Tax=Petrolisthes cinctipes TaxID=88211 RepID=A0AAE1EQH2_PETCI|nr:hypothetical protein Pcinc_034342 [Petrolisthes cinctipes]